MVFEKVREIICDQLDVAEDDVTMESNIADDLGADSLDVVDLVMSLEEEFDAEFPRTSNPSKQSETWSSLLKTVSSFCLFQGRPYAAGGLFSSID